MASTSINLRSQNEIYLVGNITNQIVGSKLPLNRQTLSVLFYNLRHVKLNLHESAKLVIDEVSLFWHKARIPIRENHRCVH